MNDGTLGPRVGIFGYFGTGNLGNEGLWLPSSRSCDCTTRDYGCPASLLTPRR